MSGLISGNCNDDVVERYNQRLHELIQKNPNKSLASSACGSLSESIFSGQYFNNKGQLANGTLPPNQFYKNHSGQDQFRAENILPNQNIHMEGSSTYGVSTSGVSDASVFKKPLPVKRFNCKSHIDRRLDLLMESLRSVKDKHTCKFMMTAMETILHAIKNPPFTPPVNPVHLMDYISNLVKEEYHSKGIPKSICGSSVMSDQASNIDQDSTRSERSIQLEKPPSATSGQRTVLQDLTQASGNISQYNRPPIDNTNSMYFTRVGLPSHHQQETVNRQLSSVNETTNKTGRPPSGQQFLRTLMEETGISNIFNDTEIARRRDEAAARQDESEYLETLFPKKSCRTLPKSTPKPNVNSSKVSRMTKGSASAKTKPTNSRCKESVTASENCTLDQGNKNTSVLNGTRSGVSRSGRTLKAPVKYWNSRGEEVSTEEIDESVFNESMTLRNRKVLDNKKTPLIKGKKTYTPTLPEVPEKEVSKPSTTKKSKGRPALTGKENVVAEKKKPAKKQSDAPVVKNTSSKVKTVKKKEVEHENIEKKAVKKPPPKRKSKESNETISKKKKIEDPLASDLEEDDIFGAITYKKPSHQNRKVALSPSTALLSAKKAAGEAQGNATPPCKAIGEMILNESIQSTVMSAAKEAPKQNEAVKRIIKKMEKDRMKTSTQQPKKNKTQVKKTSKEDHELNDLMEAVKSSYSITNPMCSATLTVFRGREPESDSSDMEQDDDDDDDDLI